MRYRARTAAVLIRLDNKIAYRDEVNIIYFERSTEGANETGRYAVLDEFRGYIFLLVRMRIQVNGCF